VHNDKPLLDGDQQAILAAADSNQPPDVQPLEPMVDRKIASTSDCLKAFISDAGHWRCVRA
jgi:hypothetical protein